MIELDKYTLALIKLEKLMTHGTFSHHNTFINLDKPKYIFLLAISLNLFYQKLFL